MFLIICREVMAAELVSAQLPRMPAQTTTLSHQFPRPPLQGLNLMTHPSEQTLQ